MKVPYKMECNCKEYIRYILSYKVCRLYITYKDRLSRISFDMFQRLFVGFGCEIVVINDSEGKSDETEINKEIIPMLHYFAMKMYNTRIKFKLKISQEDLKNEISL